MVISEQATMQGRPKLPANSRIKEGLDSYHYDNWYVAEDRGQPLTDEFDPEQFFAALEPLWFNQGDSITTVVLQTRARQGARPGLSIHEADWLVDNWGDQRIPGWLHDALNFDEFGLAVTDTVLLLPRKYVPEGPDVYHPTVLDLCCGSRVIEWGYVDLCCRAMKTMTLVPKAT